MKNKQYIPHPLITYVGGALYLLPLTLMMAARLTNEDIAEIKKNSISKDVKQNYVLLIYEETRG